jgi:hypothetical protein
MKGLFCSPSIHYESANRHIYCNKAASDEMNIDRFMKMIRYGKEK